jgi:hypothetical protein
MARTSASTLASVSLLSFLPSSAHTPDPKDGSLVKIWTCYANTPQQQWYYTNDNRLALTGKGLCLDLPSGNTANGQQLQVWSCANGNPNQEWTSTLKAGMRRRRYARAQIADQLA